MNTRPAVRSSFPRSPVRIALPAASSSTTSVTPSVATPSLTPSLTTSLTLKPKRHRRPRKEEQQQQDGGKCDLWVEDDPDCVPIDETGHLGRHLGHRDHVFPEASGGRYVYRQYDNGSIRLLESPAGSYSSDTPLVTQKSNPKAWKAINGAIYARRVQKSEATVAAFATIAASAAAAASALTPQRRQERVVVEAPPEEARSFPWAPVAVGGAVLVVLASMLGGRK